MNPLLDRNKSSPLPLGKVCIVFYYKTYYAVSIVDLASSDGDGGGFFSTAPTLLIDRDEMPERGGIYNFCVLHSRLYMFEDGGKSAYTYDLYPHLITEEDDQSKPMKVFDESMVKELLCSQLGFSFMNSLGLDFPAPLRSILSCTIILLTIITRRRNLARNSRHFSNSYPALDFFVESFSFIKDSVFLIQTSCFGMFTLDIDDPSGGWQRMHTYAGSLFFPFGRPFDSRFFLIEDDKLCIDGFAAYDISSEGIDLFYPENAFWFPELLLTDGFPGITDIGYEHHIIYTQGEEEEESGKLFGTVRLVTGIQESTEYAYMRLEVLCFNLDKYREDKKKTDGEVAQLETTLIKALRFVFDGDKCFHFDPVCLFPIAAYSRNTE